MAPLCTGLASPCRVFACKQTLCKRAADAHRDIAPVPHPLQRMPHGEAGVKELGQAAKGMPGGHPVGMQRLRILQLPYKHTLVLQARARGGTNILMPGRKTALLLQPSSSTVYIRSMQAPRQ